MPRLLRLAEVRSIMSAARGSIVARNACRDVSTTSARGRSARWFLSVERRRKHQSEGLARSRRGPSTPARSPRHHKRRRAGRRRAGVIDAGRKQARTNCGYWPKATPAVLVRLAPCPCREPASALKRPIGYRAKGATHDKPFDIYLSRRGTCRKPKLHCSHRWSVCSGRRPGRAAQLSDGLGGHAAHLWFTGGTHSAARSHPLGRGP